MHKIFMFCVLLLPITVTADWNLRQTDDGHWINSSTPEGHELIVVQNEEKQTHFLLVLAVDQPVPEVPSLISLTIDRGPVIQTQLKLLEQRRKSRLFQIELDSEQKGLYIRRMIAGLKLHIWFGERSITRERLQFSLRGFTVAFNDLLIASRVGRLDPEWLMEQGREKELGCFYTANLFILAMRERVNNHSEEQTRESLPRTGYDAVDEMIPDIVSQVYAVPANQLPIEPRGDKYAIFDACMAK